jgi:hypothetical protein
LDTKYSDVLKRFDTQFDERYGHFDIKCVASIAGDLHWCIEIEELLKALFPKNIWLEEFFNDKRTWDDFSGITEIVELDDTQYTRICKAFYRLKALRYGQ